MNARCKFWFGTREFMQWFPTPLSGADGTPEDWRASGSLLNGGGYVAASRQSHKVFQYSWRDSSARQVAQMMKSYRDGSYGRGHIYFVDPLTFDTNVLPAAWADPAMTEGTSVGLLEGGVDTLLPMGSPGKNLYPVNALRLAAGDHPFRPRRTFIPIPEGYRLHLGGVYDSTGLIPAYQVVDLAGNLSETKVPIPQFDATSEQVVSSTGIVGQGVYLTLDATPNTGQFAVLRAFIGRLIPANRSPRASELSGPWIGGQGHSGTEFDGPPTYIEYNGIGGGQVGFSATFKEVGLWTPFERVKL